MVNSFSNVKAKAIADAHEQVFFLFLKSKKLSFRFILQFAHFLSNCLKLLLKSSYIYEVKYIVDPLFRQRLWL